MEPLNQQLQQLLNPPAPSKPEITKKKSADSAVFRLDDRVIQTQNNYKSHVFNGDLGFVRNVDPVTRSLIVEYAETDHQKLLEGEAISTAPSDSCMPISALAKHKFFVT